MAAQREKFEVVIAAKDEFTRVMKRAQSVAEDSFGRIRRAALWGAAGAGAVTTAVAVMTKTTADAADKLGDLSTRIGVSAEALSELHHAATLSGVSTDTLNMALQRQTRRIAEAAQGTGEAKDALKELGLEARDLRDLRPDEQFMDVAEALSEVSTSADRTRLAMKLFDSEGVAVLQMLDQGAEGLRELRAEARALGVTFSEEDVAAASDFNDSIDRLIGSLRGAKNTLALELMPYLTAISDTFIDEIVELRASGELEKWAEETVDTSLWIFESVAMGAAGAADLAVPAIRGIWDEGIKPVWDGFDQLPDTIKQVGIIGFFAMGMKGKAALLAATWFMGKLEELGEKYSWIRGELATPSVEDMTFGAIETNLDKLPTHPISERYRPPGEEEQGLAFEGITGLGPTSSFSDWVEERLASFMSALDEKKESIFSRRRGGSTGDGTDPILEALGLGPDVLTAGQMPAELAELAAMERRLDAIADFHTQRIMLIRDAAEREQAIQEANLDFSKQTDQIRLASMTAAAQMAQNTLQSLFVATGSTNKALFAAYKAFAVGQAIISAELGAAKAVGIMGPFGIPLAPVIKAMGYANAAVIAAQAMTGNIGASRSLPGGGTISTGTPSPVPTPSQRSLEAEKQRPSLTIVIERAELMGDDAIDRFAERLSDRVENYDVKMVASETKS